MVRKFWFIFFVTVMIGCDKTEEDVEPLRLSQAFIGDIEASLSGITENVPIDRSITLIFSGKLNEESARTAIAFTSAQQTVPFNVTFLSDGRTVSIIPVGVLAYNTTYTISISGALSGAGGAPFTAVSVGFKTDMADIVITSVDIAGQEVSVLNTIIDVPVTLSMTIRFSAPVNRESLSQSAQLTGSAGATALEFSYSDDDRVIEISSPEPLEHLSKYQFRILDTMEGSLGEPFKGMSRTLYTEADQTPKFPLISDEELLTLVQQQTFKYFWDFAHPSSGMARERNTSGDLVTSGGSGFGIMALIVGMERGFVSRDEGLQRMDQILTFLENANRFHGAWPHWLNGNTGDVVPFSANDNGGDLVETSFLVQGLLTFRQYLDENVAAEEALIDRINILWQGVEWDWYTRGGEDVLYWHWSPDKAWTMNHPIRGYNEALITYFLAAASPTHTVEAAVYHEGWARSGAIVNNKEFYGVALPVGFDYGGPLFFAHYSFLGLDPRGLQDTYAGYWTQNVNHSRINHAYCVDNPKSYVGYSDECWGLTASDSHGGYSAHSPTNDLGVITPTAAISSLPYTPDESMKALRFFYYTLGDRLWGPYGFYDAFNITESWTADSYLAIDQGPIIVMIENHRTGLLWELFMSSPEVQIAMDKLGFTR